MEEVAVKIRMMYMAVLALMLSLGTRGWSQSAAPMTSQGLAPRVAQALKESGKLSQYRVGVVHHGNGVIDLTGDVADEAQREMVIQLVRTVPGVQVVRDWIQVRAGSGIVRTQVAQPLPTPIPMGPPGDPLGGLKLPTPRIDGQLQEPTPIFQAPPGPMPGTQPPPMPPNAWPTFAPYNNFSRVAYPNAYPYEQWPFIGPMYPFPRVPLGWRSVSLTWEDGHWWFHRNPTGHDWWRVRYW
jgi:hypothetical protein